MVVGVEWLSGANLTDSCQQVVRFVRVGRRLFIELVDLQVFVLVVRDALKARLRKFDVLE